MGYTYEYTSRHQRQLNSSTSTCARHYVRCVCAYRRQQQANQEHPHTIAEYKSVCKLQNKNTRERTQVSACCEYQKRQQQKIGKSEEK